MPNIDHQAITVRLVPVYVSNEGNTCYELRFVDADGRMGETLRVRNDGIMELADVEE